MSSTYTAQQVQMEARALLQSLEDLGTMANACDDERSAEWTMDAISALQAVARIYGKEYAGYGD